MSNPKMSLLDIIDNIITGSCDLSTLQKSQCLRYNTKRHILALIQEDIVEQIIISLQKYSVKAATNINIVADEEGCPVERLIPVQYADMILDEILQLIKIDIENYADDKNVKGNLE